MAGDTRRMVPPEIRFWSKVREDGDCWEWTGAKSVGYGRFGVARGNVVMAHRWAYEQLRAEIPQGLDLDHLCRNPACVNPWHLEPVTRSVNLRRGVGPRLASQRWGGDATECKRGHAFDVENTFIDNRGRRGCRKCRRIINTEWARKHRARKVALNG